jgi:hypothetical protein
MALVAAAAIPLGLPRVASAAGFDSIVFSPNPIAQAGTLATSSVVDICVQPELGGAHEADPVWLSFVAGKFGTSGGTAVVGTTTLNGTPQSFTPTPGATCTFTGGTTKDGVLVVYTSPSTAQIKGRDVITAADTSADSGSNGVCSGTGVCNTDTYVFSPVANYVFSASPIAAAGILTSGQQVTFTVTAVDNSTPTPQPVPGAYLDLKLTSSGSGGTATAVNSIATPPTTRALNNTPQRVGATSAGTVSITYTAGNPATSSGTDTITAQDHPTATVSNTTIYTYGATTTAPSNAYTAVPPFRVCDTRTGAGIPSNQCNTGAGSGPLTNNSTRLINVGGVSGSGVPATGVTAVVVNVTAIAPSVKTLLTVYPAGQTRPGTSNLNVSAGQVVANLVEVGVNSSGQLDLYNNFGTINVAIDVEGYVSAPSTGLYTPLSPSRICDTRSGGGIALNQCDATGPNPISGHGVLTFNVHTTGDGVPATGVSAVVFNLTAINPTQRTVLTAYPGGGTLPTASNVNVNPGTAVPNRVIVPVSGSGTVSIWNSVGSVNVAVDIDGYFSAGSGAKFTALAAPARVCDTYFGNGSDAGCTKGTVGAGGVLNINVTGIDGIPALGTPVAIVANVTVFNATTTTFVSVYPGPSGGAVPGVSDLNVTSAQPVPNLVVVEVGSDGTINLFNDQGSVNLIVDVTGYYS